jgi:hypothetical protein
MGMSKNDDVFREIVSSVALPNLVMVFEVDPDVEILPDTPIKYSLSHNRNLIALAAEAVFLGYPCGIRRIGSTKIYIMSAIHPVPVIDALVDCERFEAKDFRYFSIYPSEINYIVPLLQRRNNVVTVFVTPAVHWVESPELYPAHFVFMMQAALLKYIDYVVVQNEAMLELQQSFFQLITGNFARSRFLIAPCGFSPVSEDQEIVLRKNGEAYRDRLGFSRKDVIIINSGGVWKWTDIDSFLDAFLVHLRAQPSSRIRLLFCGFRQDFNSDHGEFIKLIKKKINLIKSEFPRAVTVLDWSEASSRMPILNRVADIGLNVSKDTLENHQSHRQRFVDYISAGIPVIHTRGDSFSKGWARQGLYLCDSGKLDDYLIALDDIERGVSYAHKRAVISEGMWKMEQSTYYRKLLATLSSACSFELDRARHWALLEKFLEYRVLYFGAEKLAAPSGSQSDYAFRLAEIENLRNSLSWKVTAPLRRCGELVRVLVRRMGIGK